MTHQHHVAGAMIWRGLKPILIAAAMAAVGISAGNAAEVSAALAQKAPEAATLAANAEADGSVRVIVTFASTISPSSLSADAASIDAAKAAVQSGQDAILVDHFGSATALDASLAVNRMILSPSFAITVTAGQLELLAADPRVTKIVLDGQNFPTLLQTLPQINNPAAIGAGGTGSGYAVGVLDTGVQSSHVFLSGGKVILEHCFSTNSGTFVSLCANGLSEDITSNPQVPACLNGASELCYHGTHVAGIAAGFYNGAAPAGFPTNGVAEYAKIIGVQVFTRGTTLANCGGKTPPCITAFDSDIEKGLEWLYSVSSSLPGGVRLASANMSLGDGGNNPGTCDAAPEKTGIDLLRSIGVGTTVSAGNDGFTSGISSPACVSTAIAVASVDKTDVISIFSSISNQVRVFAPGGKGSAGNGTTDDVLSSYADAASNTLFAYLAGTSMAAPHVAGAIASLRSACATALTPTGLDQIISALSSTGPVITDTRLGGSVSKRRIDVYAAIVSLCSAPPPASVAIDPVTLGGMSLLAMLGVGFGFWRRRTV